MAKIFVWSGATGLDDGSTWEDAYVSLMKDWGALITPGTDQVYVRDSHAESTAGALTITGSTAEGTTVPVDIRCVVGADSGTTPGNLSTGASVTATGINDININEGIYINGVDLFAGNDVVVGAANADMDITLENLRLELTGTVSADRIRVGLNSSSFGTRVRFINVTLDFAEANQGLIVRDCDFVWDEGTVDFDINNLFASSGGLSPVIHLRNLDLSNLTSSSFATGASLSTSRRVKLSRCLLPTGFTIVNGAIDVPGAVVEAYGCQIGTDSDPDFQMEITTDRGQVSADTSSYRTGGASDGERTNPISWDMDTTAGSKRIYPGHALESPAIVGWTDGDGSTAHTYRIYFASGGTQRDDDIWFDFIGPNDAATNSLGVRNTTRVAPETAASNHTTDSGSTWTGADAGTKQYMEFSYTPDKPGPISAIIHMVTDAGSTGHIFVDPKIYIDP